MRFDAKTVETAIEQYTIRQCTSFADFALCIDLQRKVWEFADLDITPLRSFVINLNSGGMTYGAFDQASRLLGFAHALPAFDQELRPYYYSQMLAVDPEFQNVGIGLKLKLAQRDHALGAGVALITWTFDPLQSRNAYLNIVKLGGVVRRYKVNYYGNLSTSALHRGLDTDRLFVDWWVGSQRVAGALSGRHPAGEPAAFVDVPREIELIKRRDMEEASRWQIQVRSQFLECLSRGLYCAGFEGDPGGGHSRYLFFKDDHQEER